jgi:protein-S-isoprenylcysteine O-methyltransferase Ste14
MEQREVVGQALEFFGSVLQSVLIILNRIFHAKGAEGNAKRAEIVSGLKNEHDWNNDLKTITRKILSFLIGTFLFSGLPLLAWGIGDVSGYFQNGARACYFLLMTVLTVLAVLFVPDEGRGSGEGEKTLKRQKFAILVMQVTSIAVVLIGPYSDRHGFWAIGESGGIRVPGLFLTLIGYTLMNAAVVTLGRQFSIDVTIQKNHKLITGGIYRFIRHPRYMGIMMFMTGISLVFRSWAAVVLSVGTAIVLIWRIRDEEKLLHQEFAAEWENYRKSSWRLIPFIY